MIDVDRTTPTRDELLGALEAHWAVETNASDTSWIDYLSDALTSDRIWRTDGGEPGSGDNAKPHPRLRALVDEAVPIIEARCKAIAIEVLADAGERFAAEFPAFVRGPDPDPEAWWRWLEGPRPA